MQQQKHHHQQQQQRQQQQLWVKSQRKQAVTNTHT
jgi:hypothetical protein